MRLHRRSPSFPNTPRQRRSSVEQSKAPAFAYRARRSDEDLNIGRQTRRAALQAAPGHLRRLLLRRFGLVILLVAVISSLFNILTLSNDVKVMPLTNGKTTFLQEKTVYQQAASDLLSDSLWNHNKITVNTTHINKQLLERFPELATANITLPLLSKRPTVYVQAAEPALLLTTREGGFVVDSRGKALLSADKLSSKARQQLPTVTDHSGLHVKLNSQALSSKDVDFIRTLTAQLAARNFTIATMVLPTASSELDVTLAGQPYTIKFNLENGNARRQAGTFLATQARLQAQNITPAKYIDVRVPGRAYYQ